MPAIGGGICQLTNALYDLALKAGAEIVERHPHSRIVPGSMGTTDRDATVAWNYIDLRFRAADDWQLKVNLTQDRLEMGIYAIQPKATSIERKETRSLRVVIDPKEHACGSCGKLDCHLHNLGLPGKNIRSTAFIVDDYWPEFDRYIQEQRKETDSLLSPMDGRRWKRLRYQWTPDGFADCRYATAMTLVRAFRTRRLASQGAARQTALLDAAANLAEYLGSRIPFGADHLVVSQSLLPFLWKLGFLGGRTFDVLMTRQPMAELHDLLDTALARHPERSLLGDFRAPSHIVDAETVGLAAARRLVSPHRSLVSGDPRKVLVDWVMPEPKRWTPGDMVVFPGPTVSRKGAYELRQIAKEMNMKIGLMGSELEGPDFWADIKTIRIEPGSNWLNKVALVIQPALIEDRPRALLQAIASGCPVIASKACGVGGLPGVTEISGPDVDQIGVAILRLGLVNRIENSHQFPNG